MESYAVVITTMWASGNIVRIVEKKWKTVNRNEKEGYVYEKIYLYYIDGYYYALFHILYGGR